MKIFISILSILFFSTISKAAPETNPAFEKMYKLDVPGRKPASNCLGKNEFNVFDLMDVSDFGGCTAWELAKMQIAATEVVQIFAKKYKEESPGIGRMSAMAHYTLARTLSNSIRIAAKR